MPEAVRINDGFSTCKFTSLLQCSVSCGVGVIKRDKACMKKLGPLMAVVSDGNCLQEELPDTEQPCQMAPCGSEWYFSDWSEVCRRVGTGMTKRKRKMVILIKMKMMMMMTMMMIMMLKIVMAMMMVMMTMVALIMMA